MNTVSQVMTALEKKGNTSGGSSSSATAPVTACTASASPTLHGTSCNVPVALEYIAKVEAMGRVGKKTIRC